MTLIKFSLWMWLIRNDVHDDWNEDWRLQPLQEDVGQWLEEGIGDEEQWQAGIVLTCGQVVQTLLQAINLGISDIRTIEEREQIQDTELQASVLSKSFGGWDKLPMGWGTGRASKAAFCPRNLSELKVVRHWSTYNRLSFSFAQVRIGIRNIDVVGCGTNVLLIMTGVASSARQSRAGVFFRHVECDCMNEARVEAECKARSKTKSEKQN
jgi:hypothetical protein